MNWKTNNIQWFTAKDENNQRFVITRQGSLPTLFTLELRQYFPKQPSKVRTIKRWPAVGSLQQAQAQAKKM